MFIWSWSEHRAVLCIVSKSASSEYFATCYCPQAKLSRGDTRVAGLHSPQEAQSSSALRVRRREAPCGFFASLTIYVMPLHVIYTGLMVMLFRAAQESTKPCAQLFNAVQKHHLQMQTHRSRSAWPHLYLLLKFIKCIFFFFIHTMTVFGYHTCKAPKKDKTA